MTKRIQFDANVKMLGQSCFIPANILKEFRGMSGLGGKIRSISRGKVTLNVSMYCAESCQTIGDEPGKLVCHYFGESLQSKR